jgi:uncharacterized integral membrane protein (TIGR00698 family)
MTVPSDASGALKIKHDFASSATRLAPGLSVVAIVTAAAMSLHTLVPAVSIGLLAVGIGLAAGNILTLSPAFLPGIAFAMRKLLRFSIVLLGLQVSIGQVASLGIDVLAVVIFTLIATLFATVQLGKLLGVDPKLTRLVAAGTAICGASAVLAANEVVEGADKDATYAVCMVTIFGTLSMFLFPLIGQAVGLTAQQFGLWSGSAIHEVAQAVGAAFQFGDQAGEIGTVAKLTRVLCLAPVVFAFLLIPLTKTGPDRKSAKIQIPWFVVGFIVMVLLNSIITVPAPALDIIKIVTVILLAAALGAMGLETKFAALRREGLKPVLLAASSSAFVACTALLIIVIRH